MPNQVQFLEKSPIPQPFTEPENMITIELNNGPENTKKNETVNKFKVNNIIKSLYLGIGIFILLGFCVTISVLLIHKGYYRSARNGSNTRQTTFEILLNNKEEVIACRTSRSLQDCCYIFAKVRPGDAENCTVEKVLQLFFQYELEANKRSKRQQDYYESFSDYANPPPNYYQDNMYGPEQQLEYPTNYDVPHDYNLNDGYYDLLYNQDVNDYYPSVNNYQEPNSYYNTEALNTGSYQTQFQAEQLEQVNLDSAHIQLDRTPEVLSKKCESGDCRNVMNTTTISSIANHNVASEKTQLALNDSKIKLRNNPRISQGTDEIKPTDEGQSLSQNRQVNPCYPVSSGFMPPYNPSTMLNPNFGMVPGFQQQPLYVINPPVYSSLNYNAFGNPQIFNKNAMQVAGADGQYYLCKPVSNPTNNVAGLPGVEIRRMSDAFTLQEMIESMPKTSNSSKSREALDCPFGTRACNDGSKCIHNKQICDNEINCNDGSDETKCSCKSRIGEIRWCDGYCDCPDGEDENNCFDCNENELSCDDWSKFRRGTCVSLTQKCDGIKQCEVTGKDEEDCTILTDHLGQHASHKISNAAGFLHRNFKGKWYPVCFGGDAFSLDVCKTEAGTNDMIPITHLVPTNDNYEGSFLDFSPNEGITITSTCLRNKAAFVECPPLFCGLRLTITNPFRLSEVDTSAEGFLSSPVVGSTRIVGGKASQPTSWPWVVAIYKNGVFHCGGVLISELWVITAAHCVDKFWFYYYEIQVGILRRFSYSPMEQSRWATIAIPHESYSKQTLKNDIALMKLSKPVRFNRYVRPICLPSESTAGEEFLHGPKPNTVCVTVGWGATIEHGADPDHLREVEIPILSHCKHREDQEGDEICAGLIEGGRDACQGDSGGPLMCQNPKHQSQWYLAGVVSHGEGCARPDEPGVYTKVSKYIGWINENINGRIVGRFPLQKCPGYVCFGTRRCVPKKRHCDKIVDCLFADDETDCGNTNEHSEFRSIINQRSFFKRLSELNLDRPGDSAQAAMTKSTILGQQHETTSKRTEVIMSEETFKCRNLLQAIPFYEKCDKVVNCEDGTDESDCECVDYLKRFHKEAICDGVTDCKDMSDETDCIKCSANEYFCRTSQKCIPSQYRCDGKKDCINTEDEWDCVALTDGRTLVFDSDLRPKQSIKGIITINRFGVWRPLCTNASVDNEASIAANVCNLLSFEDYTVFHELSVIDKPMNVTIYGFDSNHSSLEERPSCGGLFVGCSNMSLADNVGKLHQDKVSDEVELYTSPWNAVIYLNGKFRCTGNVLNSHWIITAKTCLDNNTDAYIAVLLGKGKAHLDIEGPHEQVILIDGFAFVEENNSIVLHTPQNINFSRYIRPTMITTKSRFIKEQCVAIDFQDKRSRMVVLEPKKNCSVGFRCFQEVTVSNCKLNKEIEVGDGVITCNARDGWYTAATYSVKGSCDFSTHEFSSIDELKVLQAMSGALRTVPSPSCNGFTCILGNCIKQNQICDGVPDCRNGEDEALNLCATVERECHLTSHNCTRHEFCTLTQFKCPNGKCVAKSSFCDTINDCQDNYDEPEICSCRTYLETVHPEKICDGTVNCLDRSDEKKCECHFPTNTTCGNTKLCISQEMLCDGFQDCPNGEDENHCYSLRTTLGSVNSGEVLKCTSGVWHSGCFSRNHTTSELEEICETLGFTGASAKAVPNRKNGIAKKPIIDRFDVVWIRRKESRLKLRIRAGNNPYVTFIEDSNCQRLFIECI